MAPGLTVCSGCGANLRDQVRYPIAALAQFMGLSQHKATAAVGMSGSVQQAARCHGVTRMVADRLARKVGEHPFTIWPEMADNDITDVSANCLECGDPFVPKTKRSDYCSPRCSDRRRKRLKYQNDPAYRERRKAATRAYTAECAPAAKARRRAKVRRCLECPETFSPTSARHLYCSKACGTRRRQRLKYQNDPAYRERRKAELRARYAQRAATAEAPSRPEWHLAGRGQDVALPYEDAA